MSLTKLHTCTLVLEYNHDVSSLPLGSVWLFNGDGSDALKKDEALGALKGWFRVIGPVDYEMANSVHRNLKEFFQQSGVTVIDQGVAD